MLPMFFDSLRHVIVSFILKSLEPEVDQLLTINVFTDVQWGYVVVTTPNGVLDHEEAIRQNVGGQVLGYFY